MRYIIKSIKRLLTIIYIDYLAIIFILKQVSLTTSLTNKLNSRLIRTSQYLLLFDLLIKYKINKFNIILDALS